MKIKNIFFKIFCLCIIFTNLISFSPCLADDIDDENENFNEVVETTAYTSSPLNLNCRSCVVIDRKSQTIMFGKNESSRVKMASTTKIMTATVIIENCDLSQTVEVSKKAAGTGGSRLGLKAGDKITINDLLYGLMLCSRK